MAVYRGAVDQGEPVIFRKGRHRPEKDRRSVAEIAARLKANPWRVAPDGTMYWETTVRLSPSAIGDAGRAYVTLSQPGGVASIPALTP